MAKVGLLSDSHGQSETTQRAVRLLVSHGAELLVHLGDVGSIEVLDALLVTLPGQTTPLPAHVCFGNTDYNAADLARYAADVDIQVQHPLGRLDLDGVSLLFTHGHDELAMRQAIEQRPDYLCHGHSHQMRDQRLGSTRVLNPGALFRAREYTVARLNTRTDHVEFYSLEKD